MSVRLSRRPAFAAALLAGWVALIQPASAATASDAQRQSFRQAYAAAKQGGEGWRPLAANLQNYPLYPYLEAAALEHDLRQLDQARVTDYLDRYDGLIPATDLRRDFLTELARREDWTGFLALYRPGLGDALSCRAVQARLAGGSSLDFDADLAELWTRPNLPSACDPVLEEAQAKGLLTPDRLWARIDRAVDAGQAGTVASLARWLPSSDQPTAQRLAQALRDPAAAASAAGSWPGTARDAHAATLAISRLARRQTTDADAAWQRLQTRFNFTDVQRQQILHALALFHATDFDENALTRLIDLPAAAQSDASREWRVRVALARQQWTDVLDAIAAMPSTQQADGEWRYFRARALTALGREAEARSQLAGLAGEPTFFGFMAADQLNQPYALCPLQLASDPQAEAALLQRPGLLRAFELFAVDLQKLARREWTAALQGTDTATKRLAADLANRRGWYDRAVFTLSSGEALRLYDLRFPLASQDGVVPQAKQAGIEPAWAYGILRAESAWMSDARSSADARGLMQLLPSTGAQVAKNNGLTWAGADSLYDPVVNVALGTRYLAQMAARYNGSPWLASAAYNAGPNRVDKWVEARGALPPDLFIATIPFKETREYVGRVMAFSLIYDWRLQKSVTPLAARLPRIDQSYVLPTANSARRPVVCPAPAAAPSASPPTAATSTGPSR